MARFETIYRPLDNFNGVSFKVTSDGKQVNISQCMSGSSTYKVVARLTKQQWNEYADRFDVFNMYGQDPGKIAGIIDEVNHYA